MEITEREQVSMELGDKVGVTMNARSSKHEQIWNFKRKQMALNTFILILLLVFGIAWFLFPSKANEGNTSCACELLASTSASRLDIKDELPELKLKIVSRDEWFAQLPANELTRLDLPIRNVIISHTTTDNCETQVRNLVFRCRPCGEKSFKNSGCLYLKRSTVANIPYGK